MRVVSRHAVVSTSTKLFVTQSEETHAALLKNSHPGLPLALSTGLSLPLSAGLPLALSPSNAYDATSSSERRGDKTPSKLRRCLGGGVGGGSWNSGTSA